MTPDCQTGLNTVKPLGFWICCLYLLLFVASPGWAQDPIGEPVRFEHAGNILEGSLLTPDSPGPHPVFVALEGSGDNSYRRSWMPSVFPFWKDIAEFLVDQGFAVLLYDKPGVNQSTGDWQQQTFHDRAEEAAAAMTYLINRDDIDSRRIGLMGHSQGGWIAQIAGANHPDKVDFLVLLAGPAVSVKQQIEDDMVSNWSCAGVSGAGLAVRRTAFRAAVGGLGLIAPVVQPGYLARIINFDPETVLPRIQQPTLALFAGHDPLVPPADNSSRLLQFFGLEHGNNNLLIREVAAADHFFRSAVECPPAGEVRRDWAPGFFDALGEVSHWR